MRTGAPSTSLPTASGRPRTVAPGRASWLAPARRDEGALPSWMAPPLPAEPSLTSWAAPPPAPGLDPRMLRQNMPRISVLPAEPERTASGETSPPPSTSVPQVPLEEVRQIVAEELGRIEPLVDELRRGLEACRASVEGARREALHESEQELVRLALAIAERVVGREIATNSRVVALWAREALESLGADDSVRCVVSPRVGEVLMSLEHWYGTGPQPDVVVDSRLGDLACEIRGRYGRVDAGLKARLAAVAAALGQAPEGDEEAGASQAPAGT